MIRSIIAAFTLAPIFTSSTLAHKPVLSFEVTVCATKYSAHVVARAEATDDVEVDEGPYYDAYANGICDMNLVALEPGTILSSDSEYVSISATIYVVVQIMSGEHKGKYAVYERQ